MSNTKRMMTDASGPSADLRVGTGADANYWLYQGENIYLGNDEGRLAFFRSYKEDKDFRQSIADNEQARAAALPILLQMYARHGNDEEIAIIAKKLKTTSNQKSSSTEEANIQSLIELQKRQIQSDLRSQFAVQTIKNRFFYLIDDKLEGVPHPKKKAILTLRTQQSSAFDTIPNTFRKEDIRDYIISLPFSKDEEAEKLIRKALDSSSTLGKFMRKQRGFLAPSESRGTLKELADHLKSIEERNKKITLTNHFENNNYKTTSIPKYITKEDVRDYIFSLPLSKVDEANKLIKEALNPESNLGKFMRVKRGFFEPSVNRGILKELADLQVQLEDTSSKKTNQVAEERYFKK